MNTANIYHGNPAGGAGSWPFLPSPLTTDDGIFVSTVKDGFTPYIRTDAAVYEILARVNYPGSGLVGVISSAAAVITCLTAGKFCDIRIFDFTNSKVIVEKLNVAGSTFSIIDLGALANIPAAGAVLEIQGRMAAVNGDALLLSGVMLTW